MCEHAPGLLAEAHSFGAVVADAIAEHFPLAAVSADRRQVAVGLLAEAVDGTPPGIPSNELRLSSH